MRYYNLIISDPDTGFVWKPSPKGSGFTKSPGDSTFTTWVKGPSGQMQTDPGAMNIEFDFPIFAYNQSQGRQWLRVWGVGLPMIGQAANLNGANITLAAGMKPGLPLATAAAGQAGVIMQGVVFQAYGNWEGTNQTLELVCNPSADNVTNISWNWIAGTQLLSALQAALNQAFPASTYKTNVNISPYLVLPSTEPGHYKNLYQFASYLNEISQSAGASLYGDSYPGVQLTVVGNTINVFDGKGPTPAKVVQLVFQDLIGQPTWISPTQISFKTVLRSDIAVGMEVQFPLGINAPYALTSAAAATPGAPASSKTAFQGNFFVNEVHHYANLRQPDAESWNSTYTATPVGLPTGTAYVESSPGFDAN
jgi:hypothetical protein